MKTVVLGSTHQNQQALNAFEAILPKDKPQPQPGDYEVLIRVKATSLNYRDYLVATGQYAKEDLDGLVPLSDGAGEVIAVGGKVRRVQAGDRVAGIFMQTWLHGKYRAEYAASALGGAVDGMLAEIVCLHEDGLVKIPQHLSYEEAATLPCAAVTAWNALVVQCQARAGQSVLLQGTGGVSVFALQFAKMMGLTVFMTSSQDGKLSKLKEMGADHTFNYKTDPDWQRKIATITNGYGVDHVIEVGGAGTLNQSLKTVADGGNIAMIGVLTGVSAEVNTALMLRKAVHIHGIYVGSREMFEDMNRAISQNGLRPVIDRVFPFEESKAALEYLKSGQHFGKVVIKL